MLSHEPIGVFNLNEKSIDSCGDAVQQQSPRPHPHLVAKLYILQNCRICKIVKFANFINKSHPFVEEQIIDRARCCIWLSSIDGGRHKVGVEHTVRHDRHPRGQVRHEEAPEDIMGQVMERYWLRDLRAGGELMMVW